MARVLTSLLGLGTGNIFQKYWQYLDGLVHLRLGLSIADFPTPVSTEISQSSFWRLVLVGGLETTRRLLVPSPTVPLV